MSSRLPASLSAATLSFAVDFALLALPQVALTMASPPLPPAATCFAAVLALWLLLVARRFAWARGRSNKGFPGGTNRRAAAATAAAASAACLAALQQQRRKQFVSAFRGGLMLLTCASILAVDFQAFPRRLAKAENYGQGLMDVGVGAFVFAAGLVLRPAAAARGGERQQQKRRHQAGVNGSSTPRRSARLATGQQQQRKEEEEEEDGRRRGQANGGRGSGARAQTTTTTTSLPARLAKSLRASAPVAALGLVRLLTTKATQYAEHVGEYGVHWNFFLTVAVVGALAAALPPEATATPSRAGLLSAALLASHQALLSLTPVGAWVQAEARGPGWLSLNKEGVSSLPGYLALLLLGAAAGGTLRAACDDDGGDDKEDEEEDGSAGGKDRGGTTANAALRRLFARAALGCAALWLLALLADARVERVSRRACNAAYALWVSALCASTLLACMAGEAAAAFSAAAFSDADGVGPGGGGGGGGTPRHRRRRRATTPPTPSDKTPPLFAFAPLLCALNRNMLAVFLGANLLTGAANLLTDTLAAGDARARLTVALYLLAVGGGAAALDARGIDTTRWLLRGRER